MSTEETKVVDGMPQRLTHRQVLDAFATLGIDVSKATRISLSPFELVIWRQYRDANGRLVPCEPQRAGLPGTKLDVLEQVFTIPIGEVPDGV